MENTGTRQTSLELLRQIYPFDAQTRTFTIPVRLDHYRDFFNPMDPSPAPVRDLSLDLMGYLNQCSEEIPENYPLAVRIEIRQEPGDLHSERECLASLRSFYQHETFVTRAQIGRKRGQALKYLLVSILCLAFYLFGEQAAVGSSQLIPVGFLWNLLREAILIGGWVFMWEAVTLNFIEMDAYNQEIKKFQRLIKSQVNFSYPVETGASARPENP